MADDWARPTDDEDDFAATLTPELRAQEEYLRAQIAAGSTDVLPAPRTDED